MANNSLADNLYEDKMKVFISWSGQRSKTVALAFRDWLPLMFETIEPWM